MVLTLKLVHTLFILVLLAHIMAFDFRLAKPLDFDVDMFLLANKLLLLAAAAFSDIKIPVVSDRSPERFFTLRGVVRVVLLLAAGWLLTDVDVVLAKVVFWLEVGVVEGFGLSFI